MIGSLSAIDLSTRTDPLYEEVPPLTNPNPSDYTRLAWMNVPYA